MLVAQSGGAACAWGLITWDCCKSLPLTVGPAGRAEWEAALSTWVRHVPCAGPPSGLGSRGCPWGHASRSAGLCPHDRLPSDTAMFVLSRGGAEHWDHSFAVMPSPGLASCPPEFQEDFSATADAGESFPDENVRLTPCPPCPGTSTAWHCCPPGRAMGDESH